MLSIALLLGCPKQNDDAPTVDQWLKTADTAWEAREQGGFAPVKEALDQAWGVDTTDPGLRWRLIRLSVAEGLVASGPGPASPHEATSAFATGRAQGLDLLQLPATFQVPLEGSDPFARLTPEQAPVVAWTALAWARWYVTFGTEAASLDAPRIDALVTQAESLGAEASVVAWTRGLLAVGTREPSTAARALHEAIDLAPDEAWRRVDLVELVARPRGDTAEIERQREAITSSRSHTPEDEAARAVAATW